jgi:hypothetical protein
MCFILEEKYEFAGCTIRITQDSDASNPRDDCDHLGKMILFPNGSYISRNEFAKHVNATDFESTLRSLAWHVTKSDAMEDEYRVSMNHILRCVNKHYVIIPVDQDRYSGLSSRGPNVGDSDDHCDGFILFPAADLTKEGIDRNQAIKNLEREIEEYAAWATGDCYGYVIEDENGDELDSCWGFYGMEYAKDQAESSAKSQRFVPTENV